MLRNAFKRTITKPHRLNYLWTLLTSPLLLPGRPTSSSHRLSIVELYILQLIMMMPRVKLRTKVTKAIFQSRLNALNAECMNYFHQVMSNQVNHVTLVA